MLKRIISVSNTNKSIPFLLPKGTFLFELYGASGGGKNAGKGGFASGLITTSHAQQLYLYPGGAGALYSSEGCYDGGWNGGGKVCSNKYGCTGGGASDVRLFDDNISSRIIVAGGGGGSGNGIISTTEWAIHGGSGGGLIGEESVGLSSHFENESFYAYGGTQSGPGNSTIRSYGENPPNSAGYGPNGGDGAGGVNYGGGGGGGYFGGGGGFDVTGGGGGSSYSSPIFKLCKTISGNKTNHIGDGIITIYRIFQRDCDCNNIHFSRTLLFILLSQDS